tara:strand:- start:1064 stop:1264 length:201 start_codon:yes stop_codon:yes gene_type:complete
MKTLSETLQSIIKSFNENLSINFVDLRDLDINLTDRNLFQSFVDSHNNHEKVDFFDLQKLNELINK